MAAGWLGSVGGHALLGPAAVGAAGVWPTLLANPVLGVTSAVLIVPSLPDLQNGLHPDDAAGRAAVCAAWNGLYSVGSAAGPLISSVTVRALGFAGTCELLMAIGAACGLALTVAATLDVMPRAQRNGFAPLATQRTELPTTPSAVLKRARLLDEEIAE